MFLLLTSFCCLFVRFSQGDGNDYAKEGGKEREEERREVSTGCTAGKGCFIAMCMRALVHNCCMCCFSLY